MSGLLGRILGVPKATTFAGFQVQTSVYGAPIPIIYGTTRVAGNLIHMPVAAGLERRRREAVELQGRAVRPELHRAADHRPLRGADRQHSANVWRDKDAAVDFTGAYAPDGWDASHLGTDSQTPWSYLSTNFPAEAVPYQSTAYLANEAASFPNDSMSQYSWQVVGILSVRRGQRHLRRQPGRYHSRLPDERAVRRRDAGWPEIGDLTALEDYCAAAGLFISPAVDTQKPAADWVNEFVEAANTALVWSDGLLKFIPYGDTALTGHGHTYTPNTTPLYDLTDATSSRRMARIRSSSRARILRTCPINQVTYRDSEHAYNQTTYTAFDQLAIETYGVIALPPLTLPRSRRASSRSRSRSSGSSASRTSGTRTPSSSAGATRCSSRWTWSPSPTSGWGSA
jgi:hypothetical protein